MSDETTGAPGGAGSEEAGSEGRAPQQDEGSRQGSPHTSPEEGHPAGTGERSERDVGGPTDPEGAESGDESGGAPGTPPDSGFESHE